MRIARLEIENWLCFRGRHVLDLPATAIAVVASYEADARRSNWGGKTALLEAIDWCLYGVHRKRLEDAVISRGESECVVRVEFDDGLSVTRRRNRSSGYAFVVSAGDDETWEKAAAEEELDRRLGLGWDESRETTRFRQGDTEALAGDESGKRQKALRRWFRLDAFDRACGRARRAAREAAADAKAQDAVVRADRERLEPPVPDHLLERARAAVRKAVLSRDDALEEADRRTRDQERLRRLVRWDEIVAKGKRLREEVRELGAAVSASEEIDGEVAELAAAYERAKADLDALGEVVGGGWDRTCPITCEECPVSDAVVAAVRASEARAEAARVQERTARQVLHEARARASKTKERLTYLERAAADLRSLRAEASKLKPEVDEWLAGAEEGETLESANARAVARAVEAAKEARAAGEEVQERHLELSALERAIDRREEQLERIERAEKERDRAQARAAAARVAARCLGPGGVPREIAAGRVAILEARVNELLEGTGLAVTVSWQRPTQKLESECSDCGHGYSGQRDKECPECGVVRAPKMSDELELLVDDGSGEVEDVRAKSGGARVLVGTAFRLAGGKMLRELRGSPVGWALVDEALGSLDSANRDRLVSTLARMLGAVGLEQALIVSHDASVLDSLPARIQILRSDGWSRATVA